MARGGKKKHAHLFLSEDRTEGESARQVTPSRTSNQLERGSCLAQLVELKPCRVNERSAPAERDDDDDTKTMKWAGRGGGVPLRLNEPKLLVAGTYTLFLETLLSNVFN